MRPFFLLAFSPLLLASCVSPEAQVSGIRLERQGEGGARVVATVTLKNDSNTPMPMVRVRYTLAVEGESPFEIDDQPFKTVPSVEAQGGLQTVDLPAGIPAKGSLVGRKCTVSGTFYFEPETDWQRLKTELGIPLPTRSFDGESVLKDPKGPTQAASPAAKP